MSYYFTINSLVCIDGVSLRLVFDETKIGAAL